MRKLLAAAVMLVLLVASETVQAQVFGGTGIVGFRLTNAGAVRLGVPAGIANFGYLQINRVTAIIAFDSTAVFDYNDDQETVEDAQLIPAGIADTVASTLTDGSYAAVFPSIKIRVTVLAWKNDSYFMVQHTILNDSNVTLKGYVGVAVVPYPSESYGQETIEYDEGKEVVYYYRTGESPHVGLKVLTNDPYSFHSMDWETYSPDPDNDLSTDAIRCFLTTPPGFDGTLVAGPVGSIFHLTAGLRTIQPGDSVTVTYAVLYGTSPDEVMAAADSAKDRYERTITSVETLSSLVPEHHQLWQNYPNPFNPSTQIRFDLARAEYVTLRVYDLLGNEIAALVNQNLQPGTHAVNFSGAGLPSGMYVARLETGGYAASRKMLLMK